MVANVPDDACVSVKQGWEMNQRAFPRLKAVRVSRTAPSGAYLK